MAPQPPAPEGDHRPKRSSDRRALDDARRAKWPAGLQFAYDVLHDPDLYRRAIGAFWMVVAALGALGAGGYLLISHNPLWAKGGISLGASALIAWASQAFSRYRKKRRVRKAERRQLGNWLPGQVVPSQRLPPESPQGGQDELGEPGEHQG